MPSFPVRWLTWVGALLAAAAGAWAQAADAPMEARPTARARIEALEKQLESAAPAERFELRMKLARAVSNADKALAHAAAAAAVAGSPHEKLTAELELARIERRKGLDEDAIRRAAAGEAEAARWNDDGLRLRFLTFMAHTELRAGRRPAALEAVQRALGLLARLPESEAHAAVYNAAGLVSARAEQWEESKAYFERAIESARRHGDHEMVATAAINLGNSLSDHGRNAEAMAAYDVAQAACEAAGGWPAAEANTKLNRAMIHADEGRAEEALALAREALEIHLRLGLRPNIANARRTIAAALRLLGRPAEAKRELERGLAVVEAVGTPVALASYYGEFALVQEALGDFRAALDYTRRATELREKMVNEASRKRLAELRERFDAVRRDQALVELQRKQAAHETELARARWEKLALGGAATVAVLLTAAVIVFQRQRLKARNAVLAEALRARAAAEDADRMKTRLLGVAAHDIRAPLASVSHAVGHLRATRQLGAVDDLLASIQGQLNRVIGHARDFLDIAALESGKLVLNCDRVDLADLVRAVAEEQQWLARSNGQWLVTAIPDGLAAWAEVDTNRFRQVLNNLVDNALKFSPQGSRVTLAIEPAGGWWRLNVRDQGPGLSVEDVKRLYEPFERASARPTNGQTSHGYGLSIAFEIVRLHGGRITVESPSDGGAIFSVELAVAQPDATVPRGAESAAI